MTTDELRRIAQMYGTTEAEVRQAEYDAARAPLTPLFQVEGWPSPHSRLARLTAALKEPGALDYLQQHLEQTLTPEMSATLRAMPYEEFLGTQYWWLVRGLLYATRGVKCEGCGMTGIALDAHHLTYEHRGSEVFHLEDLRLICRPCHEQAHGE